MASAVTEDVAARALPGAALARLAETRGKWLIILPPMLFLLVFFLIPFAFALVISFADTAVRVPPFSDILSVSPDWHIHLTLNLGNFKYLLTDEVYGLSYLYSIKTAFFSTIICLVLGYPMAYAIARCSKSMQSILLLIIILPFWTSFLLRVYALEGDHSRDRPAQQRAAVARDNPPSPADHALDLGRVPRNHLLLPAVHGLALVRHAGEAGSFPCWKRPAIWAAPRGGLPRSDFAAVDARIIAGSMLVFIPAIGEFVIPTLLGGPDNLMIGRVLWDEFFATAIGPSPPRWPSHSWCCWSDRSRCTSTTAPSSWSPRMENRISPFLISVLCIGIAILYLPILVLIGYSFNASALVSVWGGFSTHWYTELVHNDQILDAAWLSLKIGVVVSTGSVILGTLAAISLVRFKMFPGGCC